MGWFTKSSDGREPLPLPDIWHVCPKCQAHVFKKDWEAALKVCPKCGHHDRLPARERIALLVDPGTFREYGQEIVPTDHLSFSDAKGPYAVKAAAAVKKSGASESVVTGSGDVLGTRIVLAVMDFGFLGGSLSTGAGEKIALAIQHAIDFNRVFVMVSASGGARMHEGILSLMQMAKVCAALNRLREAGLPYVSILTDPTTGGVTASYALLGDVNLAEPGALIGFAGRRVIETTIKQKLPDDFQTAEYMLEHGFVDAIVPRAELKARLAALLAFRGRPHGGAPLLLPRSAGAAPEAPAPARAAAKGARRGGAAAPASAWDVVQLARHGGRPTAREYATRMCDEFLELHGDRLCADDPAILGGLARIGKTRFVLVGHQKGSTTEERIACRFGMANPDGYRKAMRLMKLAEKWNLPVVTLVDTSGAYPGLDAEARGQGEAIGRNLLEMSALRTPILSIVTGEGGSGGALGIAVADRVLLLEHAIYSVISPEGCASILWRDGAKAPEAAAALKLTAKDLLQLGVADGIVPEPPGGAHTDPAAALASVRKAVLEQLSELRLGPVGDRLVDGRFRKFSAMGRFDPKKAVKV